MPQFDGNAGADEFFLNSVFITGGTTKINTGVAAADVQGDRVTVSKSLLLGLLQIDTGGDDKVTIDGNTGQNNLKINTGAGGDIVILNDVDSLDPRAAGSITTYKSPAAAEADVDVVTLRGSTSQTKLTIKTGAGGDFVTVENAAPSSRDSSTR